jgi:hypothetical protein
MIWDTESEALAVDVAGLYGEDALTFAYVRAVAATPPRQFTSQLLAAWSEMPETQAAHTKAVDPSDVLTMFKAELKRMLTLIETSPRGQRLESLRGSVEPAKTALMAVMPPRAAAGGR